MQRDHLFNRSTRPLLSGDDSVSLSKNHNYHSSSMSATIVPQQFRKNAKPSTTTVSSDYKLHGFNDFNFVANQYKNFSNKHSGYPYGSPPPSPTVPTHQHQQQQQQEQQQQQQQVYTFNDSNDANYYDDDSGCHTNNSSGNFSCRSNYSPSTINYYEDAAQSSLANDYHNNHNQHNGQYRINEYDAMPIQQQQPPPSTTNNGWHTKNGFFTRFTNSNNNTGINSNIINANHPNERYQQHSDAYGVYNSSGNRKIETIAPSPVNQFVDNGPFIFGVHSNTCYSLAGKINNDTVIKSATATPVLGTKYTPIDTNANKHHHRIEDDDNDDNDVYRRCDVAVIDGNSQSNGKHTTATSTHKTVTPKIEHNRRQMKSAQKIKKENVKKSKEQCPKRGNEIKCVVVGDGTVGKTNLILAYLQHRFTTEHVPTASDIYNFEVKVDENPVQVTLCDTAGQDFLDPLRRLCYPDSDVFLLCFSVIKPDTFVSIREKWAPIFRKSQTPIVLIGTQADLRNDPDVVSALSAKNEKPVSKSDAWDYATLIGAKYIETSSRANKNVKEAFDTAIWHALMSINQRRKPSIWKRLLCLT